MRTRKIIKQGIHFGINIHPRTKRALLNPKPHVNKQDDLCNDNKCINQEFKKNGLGQLPRHLMPQFENVKEARAFLTSLKKKYDIDVKGKFTKMYIHTLHPTQSEISNSRTQKIVDGWNGKDIVKEIHKNPIIVSNSGSVIDGHHRSEALKKAVKMGYLKENEKVRVFQMDMPAWVILSMANTMGYNKNSQSF